MSNVDINDLAHEALCALLEQRPVTITRHKSAPRDGLPLPIKKAEADANNFVTQQYRPLAILEYVNDVLSQELASRQVKQRKAEKEPA